MKQPSLFTCDVCGVPKTETNHWFVIIGYGNTAFMVHPWRGKENEPTALHICGQQCLGKKVAELSEKLQPSPPSKTVCIDEHGHQDIGA